MSGVYFDDPNREAVGLEPAWAEGYGGEPGAGPSAAASTAGGASPDLDEMTKQELLDYAKQIGATPANNDMTKPELRDSVDRKLAEG